MKAFSGYVRRGTAPIPLVAFKASADVLSKAVTLAVMVASARTLSGGEFGVLAVGMTAGWILGVASDAGLPMYLARLMAQTSRSQRPLFDTIAAVMRLRAAFGAAAGIVGVATAFLLAPSLVWPFTLIVASQILAAMVETVAHAYRGLGRTEIESTIIVIQRGITGVAALAVLLTRPTLTALALALVVPPAIGLAVSLSVARRLTTEPEPKTEHAPAPEPPFRLASTAFLREAAPVGLGILLSALYFRCDVFFVESWHGVDTAGIYNAAFRLIEALRLIPAAALAVAFPALCRATDLRIVTRLGAGLACGAAALAIVVYVSAPSVLESSYGPRFITATPALQVLAAAIPLFFLNYALTHQVIAWEGQRRYLGITMAALAANLSGNVLLIPSGGMTGAALSTLVTELVVAGGCVLMLATGRDTASRQPLTAGRAELEVPR